MVEISAIIDRVYEAAFIPENWLPILDDLAKLAEAHGTALFNPRIAATNALASRSLSDMHHKMQAEGWFERNTRAARLISIDHHGFVDEAQYFTDEEVRTQPIFTEVIRALGYGFGTSTFIKIPTGDAIIVAVEKKLDTGPVTARSIAALDRIRPHLARAAMMSSQLEFERVNAAVEALRLANLPAAVLRYDGRVMAANALLENFAPQISIAAHDFVRFQYPSANSLLAEMLAMAHGESRQASRSFPLPRSDDAPPAVVHLVPVRGNACDIFANAAYFLIVTPIDRSRVPTAETIQGLFDLSPAEARVAQNLAMGRDISTTAEQLAVSAETVRSQVKSILSKSGMSRQADFVAALASLRPIE